MRATAERTATPEVVIGERRTGSATRLFDWEVSARRHQRQRTASRNAAQNPRTISRHAARQCRQATTLLGSST